MKSFDRSVRHTLIAEFLEVFVLQSRVGSSYSTSVIAAPQHTMPMTECRWAPFTEAFNVSGAALSQNVAGEMIAPHNVISSSIRGC